MTGNHLAVFICGLSFSLVIFCFCIGNIKFSCYIISYCMIVNSPAKIFKRHKKSLRNNCTHLLCLYFKMSRFEEKERLFCRNLRINFKINSGVSYFKLVFSYNNPPAINSCIFNPVVIRNRLNFINSYNICKFSLPSFFIYHKYYRFFLK